MATKLTPLQRVASRPASQPPAWESVVRYSAGYACVMIAVAAAQLLIPTGLALMLAGVALIGLPVSLSIRQGGFRIGKRRYSNVAYARLVTIMTTLVIFVFARLAVPELFGGGRSNLFVRIDTIRSLVLLMQVFLIFAVCRCFAIITDKDAVLSTVPSFSVLLLLIVAHRGVEVVSYFLLWAVMTAILFALDHRAESRLMTKASVPSLVPGQDITLSSRALVSVVAFSVIGALGISNYLAARQGSSRTGAENWIMVLSQRLTSSAFDFADSSTNGGPERTIDFTSGPSLPTRAPLWSLSANTVGGQERYLTPMYWRMFTLGRYDGRTWSQALGNGRQVLPASLSRENWPLLLENSGLRRRRPVRPDQMERRAKNTPGFTLDQKFGKNYGAPRLLVRQTAFSLTLTSGYIPLLPSARAVKMTASRASNIRIRPDGAVEMGVMQRRERVDILSEIPDLMEYGGSGKPPQRRDQRPNPAARLSASERTQYLAVPASVPRRVRDWAKNIVSKSAERENDFRRAQRLESAVRLRGSYTLRPPNMPENREASDYFLFESRRGYCTHFANALTIACRTQGIPARVVSGFVNPEWGQDINGRLSGTALEANAHAWTEVWVDGWGWAVLDATPADDRGDNAPGFWDGLGDGFATTFIGIKNWVLTYRVPLLWSAAAFVALLLGLRRGAFSWLLALRRDWQLRREARGAARENDLARARIIEAYRQGEKVLASRYRRRAPWETPREWIDGAHATLALADATPLQTLAQLYTRARYSIHPLEESAGDAAQNALRSLSWKKE